MNILIIKDKESIHLDTDRPTLNRIGQRVRAFIKKGHHVHWLTSTIDPLRHKHRLKQTETVHYHEHLSYTVIHTGVNPSLRTTLTRLKHDILFAKAIFQTLRTKSFSVDLILCAGENSFAYWVAKWAAWRFKVPFVMDIESVTPGIPYRLATARITSTSQLLSYYQNKSKLSTFDTINHNASQSPSDSHEVSPEWCQRNALYKTDIILTYLSPFDRKKMDLEPFITQLKRYMQSEPRLKVVLLGTGPDTTYYQSCLSDTPNIRLYTALSPQDINAILSLTTIGFLAHQNSPLAQLSLPKELSTFMDYEIPVLSPSKGATYELIYGQNIGTYINEKKPETLIAALSTYLNHPSLIDIQKENIKNLKTSVFDSDTLCRSYVEICEDIASQCSLPQKVYG